MRTDMVHTVDQAYLGRGLKSLAYSVVGPEWSQEIRRASMKFSDEEMAALAAMPKRVNPCRNLLFMALAAMDPSFPQAKGNPIMTAAGYARVAPKLPPDWEGSLGDVCLRDYMGRPSFRGTVVVEKAKPNRAHRIFLWCKACKRLVPFGRWAQHKCKAVKNAGLAND